MRNNAALNMDRIVLLCSTNKVLRPSKRWNVMDGGRDLFCKNNLSFVKFWGIILAIRYDILHAYSQTTIESKKPKWIR